MLRLELSFYCPTSEWSHTNSHFIVTYSISCNELDGEVDRFSVKMEGQGRGCQYTNWVSAPESLADVGFTMTQRQTRLATRPAITEL